jgi:hypothetical protein
MVENHTNRTAVIMVMDLKELIQAITHFLCHFPDNRRITALRFHRLYQPVLPMMKFKLQIKLKCAEILAQRLCRCKQLIKTGVQLGGKVWPHQRNLG